MTALSSAIIPLNYEWFDKIDPSIEVPFSYVPDKTWNYNSISNEDIYLNSIENERLKIVMNFSQDLINNSTELDYEFVEIVNNNFWDLL